MCDESTWEIGGSRRTKFHTVESEIRLGMGPANERRRYNITTSLIGWAHT